MNLKNWKIWIGLFGLYTLIGILNSIAYLTSALAGSYKADPHTVFFEMTGAYSAFVVLPFMLFCIKKFPIDKKNLIFKIPLHIFFAILSGILHTLIMWGSRDVIFNIMDWGVYDYGIISYRFIMETSKLFFVYWMAYAGVLIFDYLREIQLRKILTSKLEKELVSARLETLQMQLNPHFLFNTLNMISSTMYENVSKADTMISNLSDLLRQTLNTDNEFNQTLSDEINKTKIYVDIMEARFQDKLEVSYFIPDEKKIKNLKVPQFLLQPIIENSIKHSQEKLSQVVQIKISIKTKEKFLQFFIEDNGPGISDLSEQKLNKGVGLSNTEERLEKLYGKNHKFVFENLPEGGLKTIIEIPIIKD